MEFLDFVISEVFEVFPETYRVRIKPKDGNFIRSFSQGQYIRIKNPAYKNPDESRPFSMASSPNTRDYLELCIKSYGVWTKTFLSAKQGDRISVEGPFGEFIWEGATDRKAVFLVGGIGIAPIMSMLRFINEGGYTGNYLLLYGNRTPESVAYMREISEFTTTIKTFKTVSVFSDLPQNDPRSGYKGFITKEILRQEVDFSSQPVFFISGPPVFVDKMKEMLHMLAVDDRRVKFEAV